MFKGSTDLLGDDEDDNDYYDEDDDYSPYKSKGRRRKKPNGNRIHPNDILSNFRDFADIHYKGELTQDKPISILPPPSDFNTKSMMADS